MSGALSVNGEPGRPPMKLGIPLGDLVGGINGPIGILAALYERSLTGRGRLIDVSLLDGLIGMLGYLAQLAFFTGEDPTPQGSEHPNLAPIRGVSRTGRVDRDCLPDEQLLGAPLPGIWQMQDWIKDPRFETLEKRRDNRGLVKERISEFTRQRSVVDLMELFTRYQVPHAPILGVKEALSQPQAVAREMVVETEHQVLGKIPIVNRPIKFPGRSSTGSGRAPGPRTAYRRDLASISLV